MWFTIVLIAYAVVGAGTAHAVFFLTNQVRKSREASLRNWPPPQKIHSLVIFSVFSGVLWPVVLVKVCVVRLLTSTDFK